MWAIGIAFSVVCPSETADSAKNMSAKVSHTPFNGILSKLAHCQHHMGSLWPLSNFPIKFKMAAWRWNLWFLGVDLFDACSQTDAQSLESVQYDAARICTGAFWNTNRVSLLSELGWGTLETRRMLVRLNLLFKMINGHVPSYLSMILTPLVSSVHHYPLRNTHHLRLPTVTTSRYQKAFLPSTIKLWNQLPVEIISLTDLSQFKRAVTAHLFQQKAPAHWNFGERSLSIFHTRLRLGLSGLNAHLFTHGLSDNKKCACHYHTEDVSHFFFSCPQYAAHRPALLSALEQSIQQVDPVLNLQMLNSGSKLELVLNGSVHLSHNDNVALFNAVQTFIYKSRGFI